MSRGLGQLQTRMLAELGAVDHASVMDLLERIDGWPVLDTRLSAGRRAMRGLVRRRLVVELPIRYRVTWIDAPPSAQKHYALPQSAAPIFQRIGHELADIVGRKRCEPARTPERNT